MFRAFSCLFSLRKVKDHDPNFSTKTFPEVAQEIYVEAHNSLAK